MCTILIVLSFLIGVFGSAYIVYKAANSDIPFIAWYKNILKMVLKNIKDKK